ncbi:hypothetical protein Hanom_Chr11g01020641 [Helianthus anomalus]
MGFCPEWGAQFPTPNSTALDAPPGYIALYAAFFREGNFRLQMTMFTTEVLKNYGLYISQINSLGLPRLMHFEFICRANLIDPTFEMFNVFYNVSYSFNSRTSGVAPCSSSLPKSLHDWKQKFFYIRRGVIPVDMHYWAESEGIPKIDVTINFGEQEWYKTLTRKATPICQIKEMALVGASISMLWVPKNPRGVPVFGYDGKVRYSLLNVLDPKATGAMIEAVFAEGKPVWLDQIRDRFLHPSSDSFVAYVNTILGEDDGDELDDTFGLIREEVIVLSSEGSEKSREELIPCSPRAGPAQRVVNELVNKAVDVDLPVETAEQLETRKKKKVDRSEKKEEKVEEKVTEVPRKRPSTLPFLDYVVVSDTLSGLGAGGKRTEHDPEYNETLTKIVKKKKALEEKKKELDEQVAAALATKRAKLQKEAHPAPSESEIDMGVFSAKPGVKSGKGPCKIDVSKITPPTSPPSRAFDLSLPRGAGDAGGDGRGKGVETEAESSQATPRHTIYTRRPPGSGGGRRNWFDLLDDHIHAGVIFFATSQEIVREWKLIGEDTLEFENAKKYFAEEREKFNVEKKGLLWRKGWEVACERTNKELQAQREAIVRMSGDKRKISDEAEQECVAHQKREIEYVERIAKLEKFVEEKIAENKAFEILAEEMSADCKWLLTRGV